MFQGWTCNIVEWVFKKVASLDIHEEEGIAVPTNGRTSTIDNIVVKDIPKKGRFALLALCYGDVWEVWLPHHNPEQGHVPG